MARRRFFVDQVQDGHATIAGGDAHHLTRVLRVEVGQIFEISDNQNAWLATVETAQKNLVRFKVLEPVASASELPPATLYLALFKFDRFEWAVEKATELGVTRIVPVEAKRSDQGLFQGAKKRVERWGRIAKEASEQSRRLCAPEVEGPVRFPKACGMATGQRLWMDERPGAPALIAALENAEPVISLAIGPEGGWVEAERIAFAEAGWRPASLGPTVLRAETAVCAALAITSAWRTTKSSLS